MKKNPTRKAKAPAKRASKPRAPEATTAVADPAELPRCTQCNGTYEADKLIDGLCPVCRPS